ncbi:hypothetical protein [Pedosphaera parvula]|uniref:Uncharacterized protein n=1 Tax=Pedosphaera parvula (strain Ellin514) TaxID=320771 RepID=B9XFS2_PEDPL|nr:hypothetical protein [Pedosphaera parvula]EEF61436.1 hypothetical protein Cflav_PD4457 [Pedosphaera parvula Ellin514]
MSFSTATIFGKRTMNRIDARDYVEWAVERLVQGKDGYHLRILAGLDPMGSIFEAEEHFGQVLRELGIPEPDEAGKFRAYACDLAERIVAGTLEAKVGLKELYRICVATNYGSEFMVWLYLDDALDNIEAGVYPHTYEKATAENFNELVKMEARRFVDGIKKENGGEP